MLRLTYSRVQAPEKAGWNVANSIKLHWVSCCDFTFALGQSITLYYVFVLFLIRKKSRYKCLFRVPTFPPTSMTKPALYSHY